MNLLEKNAKSYRLITNGSLRRNAHLTGYQMTEKEIIP